MKNDILKQAALIFVLVEVIRRNTHKYRISTLCKCLGIARRTHYYEFKRRIDDSEIIPEIEAALPAMTPKNQDGSCPQRNPYFKAKNLPDHEAAWPGISLRQKSIPCIYKQM